jgi:site-specific DNA-methyltransferase (adenine-specific)
VKPFQIITGDTIEQMRIMPSASVDAVVTDPPYGDTSCPWDAIVAGWLNEVRRILKPSGSVWFYTSLRHLVAVAPMLKGWTIAQDIVWEKHNGSGLHKDRFRRIHELAVQIYPKSTKWSAVFKNPQVTMDARAKQVRRKMKPAHYGSVNPHSFTSVDGGPRLQRSVLRVRSCHGHAIHPTQKPVGIVAPLVRYSCPPGGLVLDCFAGSGTTGVVCVQEQRQFIGIEKDAAMADKARARIAQEIANGRQQSIEGVGA